jgi:hypothetical protein
MKYTHENERVFCFCFKFLKYLRVGSSKSSNCPNAKRDAPSLFYTYLFIHSYIYLSVVRSRVSFTWTNCLKNKADLGTRARLAISKRHSFSEKPADLRKLDARISEKLGRFRRRKTGESDKRRANLATIKYRSQKNGIAPSARIHLHCHDFNGGDSMRSR